MSRRLTDEETRPVMLAAGLEPLEPYPGANKPWTVKCFTCHAIEQPRYNSVATRGYGCRQCGIVVRSNKRKFMDDYASSIMLKCGLVTLVPYPGSHFPWICKCLICGGISSPRFSDIRHKKVGCKYCGKIRGGLKLRIKDNVATTIMIDSLLTPLESYPGAMVPWKCICNLCNKVVMPRLSDVKRGHGGCKYCHPKGINLLQPALIYMVSNVKEHAIKIGIGGSNRLRINQHLKYEWFLLSTWTVPSGLIAVKGESMVLRNWRLSNIPTALTNKQMPQGGYTETAPLHLVNIPNTRRLITRTVRQLSDTPVKVKHYPVPNQPSL